MNTGCLHTLTRPTCNPPGRAPASELAIYSGGEIIKNLRLSSNTYFAGWIRKFKVIEVVIIRWQKPFFILPVENVDLFKGIEEGAEEG